MPVGFEWLLPAALIVLTAYVIFGLTGFGSTLTAIPLLAHLMPLTFVIPMIVLIDFVASVSQGVKLRAGVRTSELSLLIPIMLTGMVLGATLLIRLPAGLLLFLLGVLVIGFGASYFMKRTSPITFGRWMGVPTGLFAGTLSALFSIGGPLYVMYLAGRGASPAEIRATMPVIFIFTATSRITLYALTGLFVANVFATAALLLPAMVLGLWLGNRLHGKLPRDHAVRIVGTLLIASGISLLVRALGAP
jgi:uncharacterized protein